MVLPWTFIGHANKRRNQTISNRNSSDLSAIMKTIFEPEVRAQDSILTILRTVQMVLF